jgi:hypothetical protein
LKNSFFEFKIIHPPSVGHRDMMVSGQGERGLGLLLPADDHTPDAMGQLQGILQALQLEMERDALLFVLPVGEKVALAHLARQHRLYHLLLFGLSPSECGLVFPLPLNKPILFQERAILRAPALPALLKEKQEGGKTLRLALWQALQQIFPKP